MAAIPVTFGRRVTPGERGGWAVKRRGDDPDYLGGSYSPSNRMRGNSARSATATAHDSESRSKHPLSKFDSPDRRYEHLRAAGLLAPRSSSPCSATAPSFTTAQGSTSTGTARSSLARSVRSEGAGAVVTLRGSLLPQHPPMSPLLSSRRGLSHKKPHELKQKRHHITDQDIGPDILLRDRRSVLVAKSKQLTRAQLSIELDSVDSHIRKATRSRDRSRLAKRVHDAPPLMVGLCNTCGHYKVSLTSVLGSQTRSPAYLVVSPIHTSLDASANRTL